MELIHAKKNGTEIEMLVDPEADIELGGEGQYAHSMQFSFPADTWDQSIGYGDLIYVPDTEIGGMVGEIHSSTENNVVSIMARTWRGMLDYKIIEPPAGADYYTISGELNTCIDRLLSGRFGSLFRASNDNTGVTVTNYQFDRYTTLLAGLNKMLQGVGYKLVIKYINTVTPGYVEVSAAPIVDYSQSIELSQDYGLAFTVDDIRNGVNHLICAGKGELKDREIIHLYVNNKGKIVNTKYYTGVDEVVGFFENASAEGAELRNSGIDHLKTVMNSKEIQMDILSLQGGIGLGDVIGGRDYITGLSLAQPISNVVITITGGVESRTYSIKGEED